MHNFGPAIPGEQTVFGAQRPGYPSGQVTEAQVQEWIKAMQAYAITRICCLLSQDELNRYEGGLLKPYCSAFGPENVLHVPVPDYHWVSEAALLNLILPFLKQTEALEQKVVVHCAGGVGRTGQVMAAWAVARRGLEAEAALAAVCQGVARRNPEEAVEAGAGSRADLLRLLSLVKQTR